MRAAIAARLRALEGQRVKQGESLPIAILAAPMLEALGFTDAERQRLVRSLTQAEIEEWTHKRQRNGSQ